MASKGTQVIMDMLYSRFALSITGGGFLWRGGTIRVACSEKLSQRLPYMTAVHNTSPAMNFRVDFLHIEGTPATKTAAFGRQISSGHVFP